MPPPRAARRRVAAFRTRRVLYPSWTWEVEVLLHDAELAYVRAQIPATLGELGEEPGGVVLRMRVESLDYMASVLARLDRPFTVRRPDELRGAIDGLADRLRASARR